MASGYEALARRLRSQIDDHFDLLAEIAAFSNNQNANSQATDLVIRALDRSEEFAPYRELLWALAREHGLFPYLVSEFEGKEGGPEIPFRDLVAFEMHRPDAMGDVVFHRVQAQIYQRLRNRENVILSAPTSFGKSLIVDSLISTLEYNNIVIIVPTIALIDETRRRLSRFHEYKLVTHPGQTLTSKNLFVMTQERFLAMEEMPTIDFFFIDEFYKLAETEVRKDQPPRLSTRASLLNQALRKLMSSGAQYYMAGPSISSVDTLLPAEVQAAFFRTDYSTVAADTVSHPAKNDDERKEVLLQILRESDEPTLIYCQSPNRARKILAWLVAELDHTDKGVGLPAAADWLRTNINYDWSLPTAIERGIGLHHGRLPRWLSQYMVEAFNDGGLNVLICTNSLIEGVNTRAKRVIIVDKKIATRAYDYFTFSNIRGRAGRMFKHFVGTVHLFHPEPQGKLPDIDFPGITQSDLAPDSLLISVDEDERTNSSNNRLADVLAQEVLGEDTIRSNVGIDPRAQITLAEYLIRMPAASLAELSWSTPYPTYEQIARLVQFIWDFLAPAGYTAHGATSAPQLTHYTNRAAIVNGVMRLLVQEFLGTDKQFWRENQTVDDRIELAFDFCRFWLSHNLPSLIAAVDRITREVLARNGLEPCNYGPYAARVESGFTWPFLLAIEEYGLPAEISRLLLPENYLPETLDDMLATLRSTDQSDYPQLHPFAAELFNRFKSSL